MARQLVDVGTVHSVGLAIHVYPLYENGLRAHRGQTFEENLQESAELYAAFDKTATEHPSSWRYGQPPKTARDIGTVSAKNRMICTPCKCQQVADLTPSPFPQPNTTNAGYPKT